MIVLRPYQQILYDEIFTEINEGETLILSQAETGFGKSIIIGKLANELQGRTLILTHRIELLEQNSDWIEDCGILTAKTKKPIPLKQNQRVISMTQTAMARFSKYGADYVGDFDNVIVDEAHVDYFERVYSLLKPKLVFGFTATPIRTKKETKTIDGIEFVRKITMNTEFDVLLQGVKTKELVELGFLTQDFNIQLTPPNLEKLVKSEKTPDGYTSASLTEVFGSNASIETVIRGYEKYLKGQKTIIFNPTTKVNLKAFNEFSKLGYNVRMFDSVNKQEVTRKEIVRWFKNTPDAILLNVGVFTTGFSVNDIQGIIYNKATKSLALWLQSIGRGSRIHPGKERFLVLDMGLNIKEHGKWSESRDWSKFFITGEWKRKRVTDELQIWECEYCGEYNLKGEVLKGDKIFCKKCDKERIVKESKRKEISGKFVVLDKPKPPTANKIIEYTLKSSDPSQTFAFKILENQLIELFRLHDITPEFFIKNQTRLAKRFSELYRPVYFAIINNKELKTGGRKKLTSQLSKVWNKIKAIY